MRLGKLIVSAILVWVAMTELMFVESAIAQTAWPGIQAAARQEGRVTLYWGGSPQALDRIATGFRKANPDIALEPFRSSGGQLISRLDQERAGKLDGGDVLVGGEMAWAQARMKEGNLLRPAGPSLKDWPAQYLLQGTIPIPGWEVFLIAWNSKLVPNAPRGYADLLRPEFKGRIGMSELSSTALIALYDWLEKTQGQDFLPRLKANDVKVYSSVVTLGQAVAAGELAATVTGILTASKPLVDKGAPLAYAIPNPGLGTAYLSVALGWSRRPNAALVLLDYIMSVDGQNAWHGNGEGVSPLASVKGAVAASTVTSWDPALYTPEFTAKYREHWNRMFK